MDESTTRTEGALLRFDEPDSGRALVLDDDGRVAYTDRTLPRITAASPVRVEWTRGGADVLLDETLVARLLPGSEPGWSLLARKPGPLARPLLPTHGDPSRAP